MMPAVPMIDVADVPADAVILDVREDEEWAGGHIEGAIHVPMFQVPQHMQHADSLRDLGPDTPIVVVCRMGGRSAQVTAWLNQNGYAATNLDGGMLAWATAKRPMISADGQAPRVV